MIFYDRRDCARLDLIDAQRSHGIVPTEETPSGKRGVTDHYGHVAIPCRFFAAFPIAYQGGQKIEVPAQVYPDGTFIVICEGYESLKVESSQLFASAPYEPDQLKKETEIRLKRQPNQRAEPTRGTPAENREARSQIGARRRVAHA